MASTSSRAGSVRGEVIRPATLILALWLTGSASHTICCMVTLT